MRRTRWTRWSMLPLLAALVVLGAALVPWFLSGERAGQALAQSAGPAAAFAATQSAALPGGRATTSAAGAVLGGPGLSQPPSLSPDIRAALQRRWAGQPRLNVVTSVDPAAPVNAGRPAFPATSPPAMLPFGSAGTAAPGVSNPFQLRRVADLGAGTGNLIPEPSVAQNGPVVLEVWNWGAAISPDNGQTWRYYDPRTWFPTTAGGFCCDQVAYYDETHDLTLWVLMYSNDALGNNVVRFAWSLGQAALANAQFCYADFSPQDLGPTYGAQGTSFDQPKLARSNNEYYLSPQRYGTSSGATVIRFPAAGLAASWPACNSFAYDFVVPDTYSPGLLQRAYDTMIMAGHASTSVLRIYSWPESAGPAGVVTNDVSHPSYPANYPYRCPRTGNANADWCQRRSFGGGWAHTDRIFTGFLTGGVITFMWDAGQGTAGTGTFPFPWVYAVRVNQSNLSLYGTDALWNPGFAWQYASAAVNDRLNMAGTVMWGGGSYYQNCATYIWDRFSTGWSGPDSFSMAETYGATQSDSDPGDMLSGDYLAARRSGVDGNSWIGTCYALQGGGGNANVHPYFLWFGRTYGNFNSLPLVLR